MLRNYKQEEKLKEMGIKNPQQFMKYQMLENKNVIDKPNISFDFITGMIVGIIMVLLFVYVL